jgi:hypothetical protein
MQSKSDEFDKDFISRYENLLRPDQLTDERLCCEINIVDTSIDTEKMSRNGLISVYIDIVLPAKYGRFENYNDIYRFLTMPTKK